MKKTIIFILSLVLSVCFLYGPGAAADKGTAVKGLNSCGEIKYAIGRLDIKKKDGKVEKSVLKGFVEVGDILKSYKNTVCMIELVSGAKFQIKGEGVLSIDKVLLQDSGNDSKVKLLFGSIKVKLDKLKKKNDMNIYTPTAVVGVRGTYLETDATEDSTMVMVFKGAVQVRNTDERLGVTKEVKAGFTCTIDKGQIPSDPVLFQGNQNASDDTTPPVITVMRPASYYEATPNKEYEVVFMVMDDNLESVRVNGEEIPDAQSSQLLRHTVELSAGKNQIIIEAYDKAGNYASDNKRVVEYRLIPPAPPGK